MRVLLFLLLAGIPLGGLAGPTCVHNDSAEALWFRLDGAQAGPPARLVAPGGQICAEMAQGAPVYARAFASLDAVEGCSRLIPAGGRDALILFSLADRCEWTSHGRN